MLEQYSLLIPSLIGCFIILVVGELIFAFPKTIKEALHFLLIAGGSLLLIILAIVLLIIS